MVKSEILDLYSWKSQVQFKKKNTFGWYHYVNITMFAANIIVADKIKVMFAESSIIAGKIIISGWWF